MSDYKEYSDINKELLYHELGLEDGTSNQKNTFSETQEKTKTPQTVKNNSNGDRISLFDLMQSVCTAVVFGILIFIFLFRVIGVEGSSMFSTLHNGDKLLTSGLLYTPEQGDIIILRTDYYDEPLVKRVIAVGGQTVDIDFNSGIVYVDGQPLDEPYTYEPTYLSNGFSGPVTVPEGYVFVMGDNRNYSNDSRLPAIGFIDNRAIVGKVYLVLIPGLDTSGKRDWSRFGLVD